jgi:NADPH:quinone reductase-like Zn-dependent oxidoreductase
VKAAQFHQQGGPEVLRIEEIPTPTPAPGEVLVRVHAAALNRLDLKAREGRPEVYPMPHIGGLDVAGEIATLGEGVEGWRVGERVVLVPLVSCGTCALCRAGDAALCADQQVFGFQTQGGFAEYTTAPARILVKVPPDADMRRLAAVPTVYLTAWRMLVTRARLKRGETVLIHSVGSGVGSAALQLVKHFGGRAIVTASTDEKLARARDMGADATVNYTRDETLEAVRAFTNGEGVDIVVETVGAETWETSLASAAKNGRIVTCGVTSGSVAPTNIRHLYQRQLSILGSVLGGRAELQSVMALVLSGALQPDVAGLFPLDALADAHRTLENRAQYGKLVIAVSDEA